jgi:hypothetical protein
MRLERILKITMKEITDRMANATAGAKFKAHKFKNTKRIMSAGERIHKCQQYQRNHPGYQFKILTK